METQFYETGANNIDHLLNFTPGNFAPMTTSYRNPKIEAQDAKIERYACVHHHVLLTGERGTGKTTIARQIHEKSSRRAKLFVSLNCATLKEELVEAELFGYQKGAFTGANQPKMGLFEIGSGGTVFLDEIGELSPSLQAKLLKAVEEKQIRRLGASGEIPVDLRIIAATSRNLPEMVSQGAFRADLFDRLNVLSLNTIPLREQKEKIREMVISGLERERQNHHHHRDGFQIEPTALDLLENYAWTGNFRELQNFVLKLATEHWDKDVIKVKIIASMLEEKELFDSGNLDPMMFKIDPEVRLDEIIEHVKELYICYHLKNKTQRNTERRYGISRTLIRRIAEKYGIAPYQPEL